MKNTFYILLWLFINSCSNKSNNSKKSQLVDTNFNFAIENYSQNSDSLKKYLVSIQQNIDTNNAVEKIKLNLVKGIFQNSKGNAYLANQLFIQTKNAATQINNDSLIAFSLTGIGNSCLQLSKFDSSISAFLQAKIIFEKQHNIKCIENVYSNLALVYQYIGKDEFAWEYIKKVKKMTNGKSKAFASVLHTSANLMGQANKLDSAISIDREGLAISIENKISGAISPFYDNLALCYLEKKQYDSSEFYFKKCLYVDSIDGQIHKMADTYASLVYLYGQSQQDDKLKNIVQTAIELSEKNNYLRGKYYIYNGLVKHYEKKNDVATLLRLKDSLLLTNKQMTKQEADEKIADLMVLNTTAEKENTIILQQTKIQKSKLYIGLLILIISIGIILFYTYHRIATIKKQQAIQLQNEQNLLAIFESEQNERIRIARDIHDSIGQKLSVLKMYSQSKHIDTNYLNTFINEIINEVRIISHNLIPEALNFGFMSAVENAVTHLNNTSDIQFHLHLSEDFDSVNFSMNDSLNLYRIFQEIIRNICKYSDAKNVQINLINSENSFEMHFIEDGNGFEISNILHNKGIGWKNIRSRLNILKGTFFLSPNGTFLKIIIPH